MSKLNRQDVFDAAYLGMASQGFAPSFQEVPTDRGVTINQCVYRSPSGCRCAIGWTIPDDVYSEAMEAGFDVDGLLDTFSKVGTLYAADVKRGFLMNLQATHDTRNVFPEWDIQAAMIQFAADESLTIPELPKVPA